MQHNNGIRARKIFIPDQVRLTTQHTRVGSRVSHRGSGALTADAFLPSHLALLMLPAVWTPLSAAAAKRGLSNALPEAHQPRQVFALLTPKTTDFTPRQVRWLIVNACNLGLWPH